MNEYKTVFSRSTGELIEKKSKFIATLAHVETNEEATEVLNEIRAKYWDARHNVYAYILKDGTKKYSDDGEPSGTSALPSLSVLEGSELVDVIVVITRYFGGTLLGTGGLVRAYSGAVKESINNAQIVVMCNCNSYKADVDYTLWEKLKKFLEGKGVVIENCEFSNMVTIEFCVKKSESESIISQIIDLTEGKIKITETEEKFMGVNEKK